MVSWTKTSTSDEIEIREWTFDGSGYRTAGDVCLARNLEDRLRLGRYVSREEEGQMNGEDRRHLAGAEAAAVRSAVPDKLLYTVEEAAALLSLSRTSVFQLISEHRLAAVKIGGRRRVAHRALDDFVASLETEGIRRSTTRDLTAVSGWPRREAIHPPGRTDELSATCALGATHVGEAS